MNEACTSCAAVAREARLPTLVHDTAHHIELLEMRHNRDQRCAITGLSKHQLLKIGEKLSVDRINPYLGYVRGNCQIIAYSLNRAKGRGDHVPQSAIRRLLRRASRTRDGRFTLPVSVWPVLSEGIPGTAAVPAVQTAPACA